MEEEGSQIFKSSFTQGSFPSPDGSLVASVQASRLVLQDANTYEIVRPIQLSSELASGVSFIKWSPWKRSITGIISEVKEEETEDGDPIIAASTLPLTTPLRILVADDQVVEVYDAGDAEWRAVLNPGFGGMKYVDFGGNEDEVVVLSEFGVGFGYRPRTNHFALLTRPAVHDILNLYSPLTYNLITSVVLPSADAQGLKWSPDGRWIAIWDSPSAGYRVVLYTADGHLFRTHEQPCVGLGLRSVEWSGGGEYLVLGGYDGRIICLNNFLFNPVVEMRHTTTMKVPNTDVWSEELYFDNAARELTDGGISSYRSKSQNWSFGYIFLAKQPVAGDEGRKNANVSVDMVSGNNVAASNPRTAVAGQSDPVAPESRRPAGGGMCATNIPAIYLWCQKWDYPRTVKVSRDLLAANLWFRWVGEKSSSKVAEVAIKEEEEGDDLKTELDAGVFLDPIRFVVGDKERYQIVKLEEALVIEE
ncbi:hypothetical protein ABW19_dt0208979 [Dactylella cylindrospora]|nr:hypothetical protein ABW19_dt0208979 [Dactylella cylindrospora]